MVLTGFELALQLSAAGGAPMAGAGWKEGPPLTGPALAQLAVASMGETITHVGGLGLAGAGTFAAKLVLGQA